MLKKYMIEKITDEYWECKSTIPRVKFTNIRQHSIAEIIKKLKL